MKKIEDIQRSSINSILLNWFEQSFTVHVTPFGHAFHESLEVNAIKLHHVLQMKK